MTIIFTKIRSLFTVLLAILYLSNLIIKSEQINYIILAILVLIIGFCFSSITGSSKIIGYIIFATAIALLIIYNAPFNVWMQSLEKNLFLVVMFILVPLLKIPIQQGGYFHALKSFFPHYVNTNNRFYMLSGIITNFIGTMINIAALPLVDEISKATKYHTNKKLLSTALSRGFVNCSIWAPTMAAPILILHLTGVSWSQYFPYAGACAALVFLVGYFMNMYEYRGELAVASAYDVRDGTKVDYKKIIELCVFAAVLFASILLITVIYDVSTITVVSFAALIFPVIWMAIIKRLPILISEVKGNYFHQSLPHLNNEIILFIGAGLLAGGITYSKLGDYVPYILNLLVGDNVLLFTIAVMFGTLFISALGVHPIITTVIIGETINIAAYGITPVYMSLLLGVSWTLGLIISPASATIISLANLTEQSPIKAGLHWNGLYVLISSTCFIAFITILRLLNLL
jgi:hypothetical protein